MAKATRKPAKRVEGSLEFTKAVEVGTTKVKEMPKRGTSYQEILDAMGKLDKNTEFTIKCKDGITPRELQNRLGAARRLHPVAAPKGFKFRSTSNEAETGLVIKCVPDPKQK